MTDEKPPAIDFKPTPALGDGFDFPQDVDDLHLAFPATVMHLMPVYDQIPDEFKDRHSPWSDFVSQWFFRGWKGATDRYWIYMHPDIDGDKAERHLRAILGSYEPKHEHKEAAVAYLMSRWFGGIRLREKA